jgi:hypothetical protein
MDIFSHGLWAGAAYKAINKKAKRPLNAWLAGFWGMFPDLFAFTIGFVWLFVSLIFGDLSFADLPGPDSAEPAPQDTLPIFLLTSTLYSISHSAVIFLVIFGLAFLVFRRPIWELGGWLIHILLDIPTHSYQFYPTPFLWPLSGWKFDGFSWGTLWFLIPNYLAIIAVYLLLRNKKKLNPTQ